MQKDLRTKINELPVCEDIELIDTLIAIGTDGKTYRVNKDNVGGKVNDWVFLNYHVDANTIGAKSIDIDATQFDELFNIGGKIHVYLHRTITEENAVELVELSFIMGSNISEGMIFCGDYQYPFSVSSTIVNDETMTLTLTHTRISNNSREIVTLESNYGTTICEIITLDSNYESTSTIDNFQLDGIYFEPLPFLNVTREEEGGGSPA